MRSLRALAGVRRPAVDLQSVTDFVRLGCRNLRGSTLFADVASFPAASFGWVSPDGSVSASRYWSLPTTRLKPAELSVDDTRRELTRRLREAVTLRLRADVPVAVQLSGGLDSSTIAAPAADIRQVDLYTVAYEPGEDEEPFARAVADCLGNKVTYTVITPTPICSSPT